MKSPPAFKVADRVVSFRGERATITDVIIEHAWEKSHKVMVLPDDPDGTLEPTIIYYEGVFFHA